MTLAEQFIELTKINSVSLQERRIADAVKRILQPLGMTVIEDDAAKKLGGNCGNLICLPKNYDSAKPSAALCAHLDTVQPTEGIVHIVDNERIKTDGRTILGGDDRLGLSVIIHLLKEIHTKNLHHKNFICVFTVAEELGMYGAEAVDLSPYNVTKAFVLDSAKRPGTYIKECAGCELVTLKFFGKSSHAGIAPEEGINAIALAAKAIAQMPTGKINQETTFNFGIIKGGSATNVVPDSAVVECEVRSLYREKINQHLSFIENILQQTCNGRYAVETKSDFVPYVHSSESEIVRDIERALTTTGLTPHGVRYSGGSDANVYNAKGVPAVNIGTGAQKPHSLEEFVLIEDLLKTYEVTYALIEK
ncbi:MAG: M20/M25/M40 family metallo-hydrolase [Bacteroidetes bacterium]|nr:M20/M25/M40 family metallo-hydrolase [Bacteroidota bacterium]